VHCRICSQLRPYIRANAVRAFGNRAGLSVFDRGAPRSTDHAWTGRRAPGPAPAMEPVSMRVVICVPAISAGLIGVALVIGASPVMAADCLTEPNRDAPPGQHWYYRVDHANDRKCWYLRATITGGAEAPPSAMELQSVHPQRRQVARAPAAELQRGQIAAPQRPSTRSEADEAALYLEFLRWREQNRGAQ
jgi:hypothetical protein